MDQSISFTKRTALAGFIVFSFLAMVILGFILVVRPKKQSSLENDLYCNKTDDTNLVSSQTLAPDTVYNIQMKVLEVEGPGAMIVSFISLLIALVWLLMGEAQFGSGLSKMIFILLSALGVCGLGFAGSSLNKYIKLKKMFSKGHRCYNYLQQRYININIIMTVVFILQFIGCAILTAMAFKS